MAVKKGKTPDFYELSSIKFNQGVATLGETGEKLTGKIKHQLKDGSNVVMEYVDGALQKSTKTSGDGTNELVKTYIRNEDGSLAKVIDKLLTVSRKETETVITQNNGVVIRKNGVIDLFRNGKREHTFLKGKAPGFIEYGDDGKPVKIYRELSEQIGPRYVYDQTITFNPNGTRKVVETSKFKNLQYKVAKELDANGNTTGIKILSRGKITYPGENVGCVFKKHTKDGIEYYRDGKLSYVLKPEFAPNINTAFAVRTFPDVPGRNEVLILNNSPYLRFVDNIDSLRDRLNGKDRITFLKPFEKLAFYTFDKNGKKIIYNHLTVPENPTIKYAKEVLEDALNGGYFIGRA